MPVGKTKQDATVSDKKAAGEAGFITVFRILGVRPGVVRKVFLFGSVLQCIAV